ncbi:hypothetical protein J6590_044598 [Homalodisca vitripennis]|nr:hypothetical protein J6590_044598 [Homalodisca vitripennis]
MELFVAHIVISVAEVGETANVGVWQSMSQRYRSEQAATGLQADVRDVPVSMVTPPPHPLKTYPTNHPTDITYMPIVVEFGLISAYLITT